MHSASTRFNGITLFTCSVLAVMCLLNWTQSYLMFNPKTDPQLEITTMTNFINTSKWDQASFKYSLQAGNDLFTEISPLSTLGTSSSSLSTWKQSGPTQPPTYFLLYQVHEQIDCHRLDPRTPRKQGRPQKRVDNYGRKRKIRLFGARRLSFL